MKIRNGFVSNSSSSSFIIGFTKEQNPNDAEFLKNYLFDGNHTFMAEYSSDWLEVDAAVECILNEINSNENPLTVEKIAETIASGSYNDPRIPKYDYSFYDNRAPFPREGTEEEKEKHREESRKHFEEKVLAGAMLVAQEYMNKHPNLTFYYMSYSDNDGSMGSTLEHGRIWDDTTHLKISNH